MLASLVLLSTPGPAFACTIVMAAKNGVVLAGNNEDWNYPLTVVWFVPAKEGEYGRVYVGMAWDLNKRNATGGMNDQGLFIDGNGLDEPTGWVPEEGKPTFKGVVEEYVLAHCATVEEAIGFFKSHNVPNLNNGRFPIMDKSGDSVVVEWHDGETRFIRRSGDYQISTNFVFSAVSGSEYPCYRYRLADRMMAGADELSTDLIRNVLNATHFEGAGARSTTLFSNICDLKNGKIYIYNFHNYNEFRVFDLSEQLSKEEHYFFIPSLFPELSYAQRVWIPGAISNRLTRVVETRGTETLKEALTEMQEESMAAFSIDLTEDSYLLTGADLLKKNKLDQARALFEITAGAYEESWRAFEGLCLVYIQLGDNEKALAAILKAKALNPESKDVNTLLEKLNP
jgi:predicted choloylglycine hydrolase